MKFKNLLIISNSFPDEENMYIGNIFVKEQLGDLKFYFENVFVVIPTPYGIEYLRKTEHENYEFDNVKVYFPKYFNFPLFYFFGRSIWVELEKRSVLRLIQKENLKFDLIHAHFTWPSGAIAVELKKELKVPVMITEHIPLAKALENKDKIYLETWKKCDGIIRVREGDIAEIIQHAFANMVYYIPNGFSKKKFNPIPMNKSRSHLNLPLDKKILLYVGVMRSKGKGHSYLIEAMREIVEQRNDVISVIVGDGLLRKELEKQIRKLNLENYVKLVGAKSHNEIPLWMNACDLFVLPSLNESFGIVQIEAMACGKPVVATRNGGSEEIIINDKLGILVEPKDPLGLAQAILRALETEWDEEYIREYAEQFAWENIAKQVTDIYESVMKR